MDFKIKKILWTSSVILIYTLLCPRLSYSQLSQGYPKIAIQDSIKEMTVIKAISGGMGDYLWKEYIAGQARAYRLFSLIGRTGDIEEKIERFDENRGDFEDLFENPTVVFSERKK